MNKNKTIICKDVYGKKYKFKPKDLRFRPGVYGVVIENGQVLLSKQWHDGYDFPGGGIEINETIDQALKREYIEETGVEVEPLKLIGCFDAFHYSIVTKEPTHGILMYYLCKRVGGKLGDVKFDKNESVYIDMPEWVDLKKIDKLIFYNPVDSVGVIRQAIKMM